jgi:hypothetical protein
MFSRQTIPVDTDTHVRPRYRRGGLGSSRHVIPLQTYEAVCIVHNASHEQENTMNADEPINGVGPGRPMRIIQDANGRFYVERDGLQTEEAFHRGSKSDAVMRADGYRPVAEVYPGLREYPVASAGIDLDDLYVAVAWREGHDA